MFPACLMPGLLLWKRKGNIPEWRRSQEEVKEKEGSHLKVFYLTEREIIGVPKDRVNKVFLF